MLKHFFYSLFFTVIFAMSPARAAPTFFITSGSYAGNTAGTACTAGYHICMAKEWLGRSYNASATGAAASSTINSGGRIDGGVGSGNCIGWTSNSAGVNSRFARYLSNYDNSTTGNDFGWLITSDDCSFANQVMCCSN